MPARELFYFVSFIYDHPVNSYKSQSFQRLLLRMLWKLSYKVLGLGQGQVKFQNRHLSSISASGEIGGGGLAGLIDAEDQNFYQILLKW